ncbi:MAG: GntR family transcriptional regulator [Planctomycetales bacterium]|nr:GntR family transcriptional regulator [Planctomycetales bacterium]
MLFRIQPNNGIPIYDQVVRQVKYGVAAGAILPGELVPSVREMAKQLAINPNTVSRAYRQLQDDDVLEQVRGTGLQVAADAKKLCRMERSELVRDRFRSVLAEGRRSGLSDDELTKIFNSELKSLKREGGES